ncbi:LuxR C-terminal-related transcriptional regulator [Curtobacterium sp. MCPF17_002]|uniref:ATP-binding protein n=1 Tax=Curtobacterium sp. MCPF17_002 TaxID=2175645 RepID=UPI000DA98B28|nr:LuxR C-terminal-related transcriptional regulator [Curtobacterium sp. MCPF17_002]WIB77005.1 LuxR C-terminal-related transcriptional regulator [Curtobacterium sp. MCPF17_002]
MLIWQNDDVEAVDAAAGSAIVGQPKLVVVHGGPGSGRSSFLRSMTERVLARAAGDGTAFTHWSAGGTVKSDQPRRGLIDLGVLIDPDEDNPLQVEQALREAVDDVLDEGPLLITIDDLQWIDPETVEALARLLTSAVAERLLVIVTTGYFEPFQHLPWQALVGTSPLVVPVELGGLDLATARAVLRDIRPEVAEYLVRRLWQHTRGNPLFLTSLVRRNTPAALERMVQLPAPLDYAHAIEVRLATLGHDAVTLARAVSVIGMGWMPLAEAAYVAAADDDVTSALDVLVLEFILEQRSTEVGTEVRMVHAIIQASIYQNIPAAERVRLHRRAAEVASDEVGELRHSYAATTTHDEALAQRLEAAAELQHAAGQYRTAAQYLDWACRLSANGLRRSARWTASCFERLLSGNVELVRNAQPELRTARDRIGAALVEGALHVLENDWCEAVKVLTPVAATGEVDLRAYRIEVLLAWASLAAGMDTDAAWAPLDRAEAMPTRDDSLAGLATFTSAMLDRRRGRSRQLNERLGLLPQRPGAVPLDDTYWLAWRGFAAVMSGRAADAIEPLREVDSRMSTGLMNVGDGLSNAFLGLAHWWAGDAGLAARQFRVAEGLLLPRPNPMSASYAATGRVIAGDREGADALLTRARDTLQEMPWAEGVYALLVGSVTTLHAFGNDAERAAFLPGLRRDFGDKADKLAGSAMWGLHAAIACVWAGELDEANGLGWVLAESPWLAWGKAAQLWVQGLVAEHAHEDLAAIELIAAARSAWPEGLPVFAAHITADLARVAGTAGDRTTAVEAARSARAQYTALEAVPYLLRDVDALPSAQDPAGPGPSPVTAAVQLPGPLGMLSDRERDVASLVVKGMSYAQIARELFISRSTVSFHLTRIYAKTDTTSRHELSDLARQR